MTDYPRYKTQIEIARERKARYEALVGFGDSGTYEDINEEELQEYFDRNGFPKASPGWPGPWQWIALLAVAVILCIIEFCT